MLYGVKVQNSSRTYEKQSSRPKKIKLADKQASNYKTVDMSETVIR